MSKDQHKEEHVNADLAQAFKDLAKGEQAASALENRLTSVEQKIDELLERAEKDELIANSTPSTNPQSKDKNVARSGS
ncbi:MAG: hypothetical protein Q9160_004301 [Pyrenula sp. 1 TL-2023]